MNGDLIDILELIVALRLENRNKICIHIADNWMCENIECSECLFNTHLIYESDYPIQIINVKGMINES
ncbi:hypothetical protein PJM42_0011 [Salmonella phage vB_SenP_UTK0001]|nr:hypothetical protein PJM42_0011 [Salmonella phage vB_SenP_UTK0001]